MKQNRVPVSNANLQEKLKNQLRHLKRSMVAFDGGHEEVYEQIAICLRILFHSKGQSKALANQLSLLEYPVIAYGFTFFPDNLIPESCLTAMRMGHDGISYIPLLDQIPIPPRQLSFQNWWEEPVIRDNKPKVFSRKDLVLNIAETDGGGHVDSGLDEDYFNLKNLNTLGWSSNINGEVTEPRGPEAANMRHIAFEAYGYLSDSFIRTIGNRPCICDSGRKGRYCCLKEFKILK